LVVLTIRAAVTRKLRPERRQRVTSKITRDSQDDGEHDTAYMADSRAESPDMRQKSPDGAGRHDRGMSAI